MRASLLCVLASLLVTACGATADRGPGHPAPPRPAPRIARVEPNVVEPGGTIRIHGSGFGDERGSSYVVLANQPVNDFPTVMSWSDSLIEAVVAPFVVDAGTVSVTAGGASSNSQMLWIELPCERERWSRRLPLPGTESSEGFAVLTDSNCTVWLAGRARRSGQWDAFLLRLNAKGEIMDGWPRYYGGDYDDAALALHRGFGGSLVLAGYLGGSQGPRPWVAQVNGSGDEMEGWPFEPASKGAGRIEDVAPFGAGYAAAGWLEDETGLRRGYVAGLSPDGTVQYETLVDASGDSIEPRGIARVTGGVHALAGTSTTQEGAVRPWRRTGFLDQVYAEVVGEVGRELHATALLEGGILLAVGEQHGDPLPRPYRASARDTGLTDPFERSDPLGDLVAAHDVEQALQFSAVVAGRGRDAAILAHVDCRGGFIDQRVFTFDGGTDAVFHDVDVSLKPDWIGEGGYAMTGSVDVAQDVKELIVAWAEAFQPPLPEIAFFDVDGAATLHVGGPVDLEVELAWHVEGAEHVELRLVDGPPVELPSGEVPPSGSLTVTVPASTWTCWDDPCRVVVIELVAHGAVFGRCGKAWTARAQVDLVPELDQAWVQLATAASTVVGRFGTFSQACIFDPIGATHPDVWTAGAWGLNRCFTALGIPYGVAGGAWTVAYTDAANLANNTPILDDRAPGLLLFRSDAEGKPTTLAGWGYGGLYGPNQPVFKGETETDWSAGATWFGHLGGWHTGDGGMDVWTPEMGVGPIEEGPTGPWIKPPFYPPGDVIVGPMPYIWHPALWDLRVWLPPSGGLPRVQELTSTSDPALPDPCADITAFPALSLAAGNSALSTLNEGNPLNVFFIVGQQKQPVGKGP